MAKKKEINGIRCFDMIRKKNVYAYHISDDGAAHNKSNTKCIGCIGIDLIPTNHNLKLWQLLKKSNSTQ